MQVEKPFMDSKLPNIGLFFAMSAAFLILMSANYKIIARLMVGTIEGDGMMVIVNLLLLAGIFAFGGFCYHVNLRKKAQLNTKSR